MMGSGVCQRERAMRGKDGRARCIYVRDEIVVRDDIGVNAVQKMGEQLCRSFFSTPALLRPAGKVKHRCQGC